MLKMVIKRSKGRTFGSVEEEALGNIMLQKKKQSRWRVSYVLLLIYSHGPNAWNEVIRIQASIRLKKKEAIKEAKRKQRKMIENIIIGICLIFFLGVIGGIIYLIFTVN